MWPLRLDVVLRMMKKYQDCEPILPDNTAKDLLKLRPETVSDVQESLTAWNQKMDPLLSSPSRQNLKEFVGGTKVLVSTFSLEQNDLIRIRLAAQDAQKRAMGFIQRWKG